MILLFAAAILATPLDGLGAGPDLGVATRANLSAMIVPPPPRGPAIEGADGVLAVHGIARMHADKVKTLKNTAISPQLVWDPSAK